MIKLDILVHPTFTDDKPPPPEEGPRKDLKKWKFPWRINMLASPKRPVAKKYEPPPPEVYKVYGPVDPETAFRNDHLSRAPLRTLGVNKNLFKEIAPSYNKKFQKAMDKTWGSIYNYYKRKLRDRRLKRLRRKLEKRKQKKPKGKELEKIESKRMEHYQHLATPKKLHLPPKIQRQRRALDELQVGIDLLSTPREHHIVPPRELGKVNPRALEYEITENVAKLAQPAPRMKRRKSDVIQPGVVRKAALKAKITPRIEKLAMPSFSAREAKKNEEDKYDPWAIDPKALKYKPTARILELAKPLERD